MLRRCGRLLLLMTTCSAAPVAGASRAAPTGDRHRPAGDERRCRRSAGAARSRRSATSSSSAWAATAARRSVITPLCRNSRRAGPGVIRHARVRPGPAGPLARWDAGHVTGCGVQLQPGARPEGGALPRDAARRHCGGRGRGRQPRGDPLCPAVWRAAVRRDLSRADPPGASRGIHSARQPGQQRLLPRPGGQRAVPVGQARARPSTCNCARFPASSWAHRPSSRLVWRFTTSQESRLNLLLSGEADVQEDLIPPVANLSRLAERPSLRVAHFPSMARELPAVQRARGGRHQPAAPDLRRCRGAPRPHHRARPRDDDQGDLRKVRRARPRARRLRRPGSVRLRPRRSRSTRGRRPGCSRRADGRTVMATACSIATASRWRSTCWCPVPAWRACNWRSSSRSSGAGSA